MLLPSMDPLSFLPVSRYFAYVMIILTCAFRHTLSPLSYNSLEPSHTKALPPLEPWCLLPKLSHRL